MYENGFDLELIEETKSGWHTKAKYKCPCGEGMLLLDIDHYAARDTSYRFDCKKCEDEYEILWGKGVIPGKSPMVQNKNDSLLGKLQMLKNGMKKK